MQVCPKCEWVAYIQLKWSKRRFVPVWTSLNRGFRVLVDGWHAIIFCTKIVACYANHIYIMRRVDFRGCGDLLQQLLQDDYKRMCWFSGCYHRSEQKLRDFAPSALGMYICIREMPWSFVTSLCSQTKILDGRTNVWDLIFELLFIGTWPKSSAHPFEKNFENAFPNVRRTFKIFVWGA